MYGWDGWRKRAVGTEGVCVCVSSRVRAVTTTQCFLTFSQLDNFSPLRVKTETALSQNISGK